MTQALPSMDLIELKEAVYQGWLIKHGTVRQEVALSPRSGWGIHTGFRTFFRENLQKAATIWPSHWGANFQWSSASLELHRTYPMRYGLYLPGMTASGTAALSHHPVSFQHPIDSYNPQHVLEVCVDWIHTLCTGISKTFDLHVVKGVLIRRRVNSFMQPCACHCGCFRWQSH